MIKKNLIIQQYIKQKFSNINKRLLVYTEKDTILQNFSYQEKKYFRYSQICIIK